MNAKPLSGLRIVAVESYGAGPWGSGYLADLGAELIKIENPDGGDMARSVGPHYLGDGDSHFFQTFNRNKRSLALNIKSDGGREVLHRLAASADAVMNNLRGDQPARLGLDYAALGPIKADIVCAHLSAYGRQGSRAEWPGYDYLMQAEAGFMSVTGEPDAPPARFGLSVVDYITGVTCALGLLAAVIGARNSGKGCDVDASLFDVALHQLSYPAAWYLNEGTVTGRIPRSAHPSLAPSQLYRTADGWIVVMCQREKFWQRLAELLGVAELLDDPDYASHDLRCRHRDRLTDDLDAAFSARSTAEWLEVLRGEVPVAPVHDIAQALDGEFCREQAMVQPLNHPDRPDLSIVANPLRIDGERLPATAGPTLGADTGVLLTELGFSAADIAALQEAGAIAMPASD
ncbi:MAG: CoA transferase [Gammaproteobacteria bacterium]|nr:CoA transferase [Gammaproteobacteria bacterium]